MKSFKLGDPTSGILPRSQVPRSSDKNGLLQIEEMLAFVERIVAAQDSRRQILHGDLFADPAWDMLVHLFHAHLAGYRLTVSNLSRASGVPPTTALRWIDTMQERSLIVRVQNRLDKRIIFIELTEEARGSMYDYLCKVWVNYYA